MLSTEDSNTHSMNANGGFLNILTEMSKLTIYRLKLREVPSRVISRTTGLNIGMFVLILMHYNADSKYKLNLSSYFFFGFMCCIFIVFHHLNMEVLSTLNSHEVGGFETHSFCNIFPYHILQGVN